MTKSAIEKIKELEEQKAELINEAREEAMDQVTQGIEILEELGFPYTLARQDKPKKVRTRRGTRKASPDKDCPICKFQTSPAHDARHHRNQPEKSPFTADELEQKGLRVKSREAGAEEKLNENLASRITATELSE
ncbi:MAG: hypothetical protein ACRBCJ_08510 [Hyphomicrobiaceae bacterium]